MKTFYVFFSLIFITLIMACNNTNNNESDAVVETAEQVNKQLVHPEWSKKSTIYEVNIRQFTKEGTFAAFDEHIERLKNMGVDILWFMPVNPIGEQNRKGTLGSYYSVKDYTAINPEFGTIEDFKRTVNKAHSLGMHVIIDWVANHSAWDNQWAADHPEWYKQDTAGNFVSPYDWSDVISLDFENSELCGAMIDAMKFWITEADIDGFRCDVAGLVKVEFWNKAREELDKVKPVFMLAEAEEVEHHDKAFDMSYCWDLHHLMNAIAKGEKNALDIDAYFIKQDTLFSKSVYRMMFTSNHDENSWNGTVFERMGDAASTFSVLSATLPGMLLIYSGQEAALNKRLQFFEKDEITWNEFPFESLYSSLIDLKENNESLWNGEYGGLYKRLNSGDNEKIFAFLRNKGENRVLTVCNLSNETVVTSVDFTGLENEYTNWFTKEKIEIAAKEEFTLNPWEYLVLVK